MNRWCRISIGALGLLVASACTDEEDPDGGVTCQPFCGSPAQTGDGGVPGNTGGGVPGSSGGGVPGGTSGGAPGGTAGAPGGNPGMPGLDAGGTAGGGQDGGTIIPIGDAGLGGGALDADADGTAATDAAAGGGGDAAPRQTLPPVTDYLEPGPFKTTVQANVGPNSNYTIFRPDPLGADGFLHAPVIFGPGIITSAEGYTGFLGHLASHGFVTISVNAMWGGPQDPTNLSDMKMGLEWLISQNGQAGVFQNKLAVNRAIAMGYSIGATAAVQLSSHMAIANTVVIHGHRTMGDPHGPVLMITGTMDVIDEMRSTLTTLEEAPAILVALPISHPAVLSELPVDLFSLGSPTPVSASTRYAAPITAWLRYWINGDQGAKRFFWGDNCEMCKSPWIPPEPNAKWKAQAP
jgi:hypothetical protein